MRWTIGLLLVVGTVSTLLIGQVIEAVLAALTSIVVLACIWLVRKRRSKSSPVATPNRRSNTGW